MRAEKACMAEACLHPQILLRLKRLHPQLSVLFDAHQQDHEITTDRAAAKLKRRFAIGIAPQRRRVLHLMPLALGAASLLGRVPRVPPRPPRVWLPPRVDGAGTRDVLVFGAGVWNLGAAVLVEDGFSTKDVSVVLESRSFSLLCGQVMSGSGQLHKCGLALEVPCRLCVRYMCRFLFLLLLCPAERLCYRPLSDVLTSCCTRRTTKTPE